MATMMAMKVVDFSFQFIAGKLQKMLEEEAALLAGIKDDVQDMVAELNSITSFLKDMSTRRNLDYRQQNWVQELREVAYDAEDSIDEFLCRIRSTAYDERKVIGFFKNVLGSIKSLKARHGIASKFKKLNDHVQKVRKRHDRYSNPNEATSSGTTISPSLDNASSYSDPRIPGQFVQEDQLVGINHSRDTIIGWVMDESRLDLTVISLVGFGGLGKTILAKTVLDDSIIVRDCFHPRVWIPVTQDYNIRKLLKTLIREIAVNEEQIRDVSRCQDTSLNTEQHLDMIDESRLVKTVRDLLQGKRYLLVFDDVWKTKAWESLSIALPTGKEGSRVIVTTRIEDVAEKSCSGNRQFIFKISPLSSDLAWELFRKKAFVSTDYNCPPELEDVGKEILKKCSGLPLAIVSIGGFLASKPDKKLEDWKNFSDNLRLEIQINDQLSKIDQILGLSYNDLSYDLKPCFLFLGTYPKGYKIRRKHLMRRWIAEGIASGVGDLTAENVAERNFNELVSRSLVQPSEFDKNGIVKSCRVHDMMVDVIISISRKVNFVMLLNEHPRNPPQHQKIRRLSWHKGSNGLVPNTDLCRLLSMAAFGVDVPLKDYRKQRLLRAIDLQRCRPLKHLHPKSFSKLFLLKYLSLRDSSISALPDSIGDLQNLEFLDIRGTDIEELPSTIVKLQKLVHLLAGCYFKVSSLKVYNLLTSGGFERLKVPKGIRKLKKLRTLGMACADNVHLLKEIGELVKLKKLGICFGVVDLTSRMMQEINAQLSKLNGSLQSLTILHFAKGNLKETLDKIDSPPLLLCKLQILAKLGGLPTWFASLQKVVEITLSNTQLQLQDMQVLRNLRTLVKLVLGSESFDNNGEDLVIDQVGFTHLKFLEIHSLRVSFQKGAVQSLEILKLSAFSPGNIANGIEHLHGIKEVHIHTENRDTIEIAESIAANHSNHPKCFVITDPFA